MLGSSGGGKTTLSDAVGRSLGIPCFSVDKAQWRPRWKPVSDEEFRRVHEGWLTRPRWIIDGWGDACSLRRRLEAADTVVFIEHPLWRHCWWALKRQCSGILVARRDTPEGCPPLSAPWRLVKAIRWGRLHGGPLARQILSEIHGQKEKTVYRLDSPDALDAFVARVAGGGPHRKPG